MESRRLQVYLTGGIAVEAGGKMVDERQFPARQGRRAFAYLVLHRRQAVSRDVLAEAIWGDSLPAVWETSLNALMSKLRKPFTTLELPPESAYIGGHVGYYQMRLPAEAWVDIEAAVHALDVAEGALRNGHFDRAIGSGTVALIVARRPFLIGEEGEWIDAERSKLRQMLVRGLECLSTAFLGSGEPSQAAQYASEAIDLEPFREIGHQLLIRAHTAAGNRSEALQVYHQCCKTLGDELGVDPSPETEALYLQALGAR